MDTKTKEELINLVKTSKFAYTDGYFHISDKYKKIDEIYMKHPKETVDIIYKSALDIDTINNNKDRMAVLHNLVFSHKDNTYIKSVFRKMILEIFNNEKYIEFRYILGDMIYDGLDRQEIKELYTKYLKTETDSRNIEIYKNQILNLDLYEAFPDQQGFSLTTNTIELNEPKKHTVGYIQGLVDARINEDGIDLVLKWLRMFYNHEYTKEHSKQVLKQIKINGEVPW